MRPNRFGVAVVMCLALVVAVLIGACGDGSDPPPPLPPSEEIGENAGRDETGNGEPDTEPVVSQCSDEMDNDGDGLVDWQLDLGCTGPNDPTEGGLHDELDQGWTVFEAGPNTTIYYV